MEIQVMHSPPSSFRFQVVDFEGGPTSPSTPKGFGSASLFYSISTPATPGHEHGVFQQQVLNSPALTSKSPDDDDLLHYQPPSKHPTQSKNCILWNPFSPRRNSKKPSDVSEHKETAERGRGWTQSAPKSTKREARSVSPEKRIRWRIKDLFLLRSVSEGRRTEKDPFNKYTTRSSAESSPVASKSSKRRGVSAHELHYKINKALSQDLKKKSFLPYKQAILGPFSAHSSAVPAHDSIRGASGIL